jgi:aldehyde dehydrogenase (NAD+)
MTTTATFAGMDLLGVYIDGAPAAGSDAKEIVDVNPYTDETIVTLQGASQKDVDKAYASAREAQREWAGLTPGKRSKVIARAAELLAERRDEIVDWLIAESGSTAIKANKEVSLAIAITREAATFPARMTGQIFPSNTPNKEVRVYRKPLGVVGVISPWNFPLHLSQRSVAPALALGNAVVLKPATDTPVTGGLLIAKIFEDAGLPAGVLNVVAGRGSSIGDYFVEHEVPSLISFTGSTPVGRGVGAKALGGQHIKPVSLELGGNAPLVVLDDADIDAAVGQAVIGTFLHSGQICMAVNRIIVDAKVYDEFVDKFAEAASGVAYGDPAGEGVLVGPVINDSQLDNHVERIDKAKADGVRIVASGDIEGRVVPPHVFADVDPDSELAQEELFGPLVSVIKAADEADAIRIANHHEFGLSSSIFTQDLDRGARVAQAFAAGMTYVNEMPVQDEAHIAFGGERNSGIGRFNGEWAIQEFTTDHTIGFTRLEG